MHEVVERTITIKIQDEKYVLKNKTLLHPELLMDWYCKERGTTPRSEIESRQNQYKDNSAQEFFDRCDRAQKMETYPIVFARLCVVYYFFVMIKDVLFGEFFENFLQNIKELFLLTILSYLMLQFFQKTL